MKVVLISNYPPDGQRSMQRFCVQLATGLEERGIEVSVYPVTVFFGKLGARTNGFGKWIGYLDKYLVFPVLLWLKTLRLSEGTIIHVVDHSNAPYTSFLKHTPHVVTCHDLLAVRCARGEIPQHRPGWTGRMQQKMIQRGLVRSQLIVSVSEATRADVARIIGSEERWQHYIPNALDDEFIREANTPLNAESVDVPTEGRPFLVHVGGEKWYKNRRGVLEIFGNLAERNEELHLVIVGPRFTHRALAETGTDNYKSRIHYLAGPNDEELRQVYRDASLLLFPSFAEGFGWPILEAQACGCPVATFNVEPMGSLNASKDLSVGNGSSGDTKLLADAVEKYLRLPPQIIEEKRIKLKAFASGFTNRASVDSYLSLYKELIEDGA